MSTDTCTVDDGDDDTFDSFGVSDSWTKDGGVVFGTLTRDQYLARRDRAAIKHLVRVGGERTKPRPDAGGLGMNFDA